MSRTLKLPAGAEMVNPKRKLYCLALAGLFAAAHAAIAADALIKGIVTDANGKPLRGAIVTATSPSGKSVSRFSKTDGHFELGLPSGTYEVEVNASGFGVKWQTVHAPKDSRIDFKLTPKYDPARLTPSQIESLLPSNNEVKFLERQCEGCHHLQTIMRLSGLDSADWKRFIPVMTQGRMAQPPVDKERMTALGEILGKYLGPHSQFLAPDATPPAPEQIENVAMSDKALDATITEYKIPRLGAMPNEVLVDRNDHVWFGDTDVSNELGELDPVTGEFRMYPLRSPNSYPISGLLGHDGSVYWSLLGKNLDEKLVNVDPKTHELTYLTSKDPAWQGHGPHSMVYDAQGNIWACGHDATEYNPKTKTFRVYPLPHTHDWPEGSIGPWVNLPGLGTLMADSEEATSSITIDSKGMIYLTRYYQATIVQLDPTTGKTKDFVGHGMVSPRGVEVDANDNVWFGDAYGHQIGYLNPRTGDVKLYKTPSPRSSPYAANFEKKTGYLYFSDYAENKIVRFDPKTETFVEYPLPTPESYPRFLDFDSKGRIWYAAGGPFAGKIGVIDPAGQADHRR